MKTIASPQRGLVMSAEWAADVSAACNRIAIGATGNSLVRDGAGMMATAPLPRNERNRVVGGLATTNPGCFEIHKIYSVDEQKYVHELTNNYILAGAEIVNLYVPDVIESLAESATKRFPNSDDFMVFAAVSFLCAGTSASDARLFGYGSLEELNKARKENLELQILPLYLLRFAPLLPDNEIASKNFSVACDFRLGIFSQQMEVL